MDRLPEDSILFEDSWVIAINKPSGLFTQAARGVPSLQVQLAKFFTARNATSDEPFVGIIHRLDRPTSGVVLFGLNSSAVRRLNDQFRQRTVAKSYLALVEGEPDDRGHATDWLRKIDDVAKGEVCKEVDAGAKLAKLSWQRIATRDGNSLLKVELETGRMHQIRLQMAARDWPIVGDQLYGASSLVRELQASDEDSVEYVQQGIFGLHAETITFRHPKTAREMCLKAPMPQGWIDRFPWISKINLTSTDS